MVFSIIITLFTVGDGSPVPFNKGIGNIRDGKPVPYNCLYFQKIIHLLKAVNKVILNSNRIQ